MRYWTMIEKKDRRIEDEEYNRRLAICVKYVYVDNS